MSGEKLKTDKAEEIWYRLFLSEKFRGDLEKLKKYKNNIEYYFKQYTLFEKYEVKPTQRLLNLCDYYFGKKSAGKLGDHFPVRIQTPSEDELKKSKRAFIKLWIYDGTTREEILNHIKKNWQNFQSLFRLQNMPKIKGTRMITNKDKNRLILHLNKLSTLELWNKLGERPQKKIYKEMLIREILETEGYVTTFEAIKGVISRSRK